MMRKILKFSIISLVILASAYILVDITTVDKGEVLNLICGSESKESCLSKVCNNTDACPIIEALSIKVVFEFVASYSECQGCSTPEFSPDQGIGKCVEYQVSKLPSKTTVTFWVSEKCTFRYASPSESRINVTLNSVTLEIENVFPPVEYLKDPLYCQEKKDCLLLQGSGVLVVGCSNYFYAPLHFAGYYRDEHCGCIDNQCIGNYDISPQ